MLVFSLKGTRHKVECCDKTVGEVPPPPRFHAFCGPVVSHYMSMSYMNLRRCSAWPVTANDIDEGRTVVISRSCRGWLTLQLACETFERLGNAEDC